MRCVSRGSASGWCRCALPPGRRVTGRRPSPGSLCVWTGMDSTRAPLPSVPPPVRLGGGCPQGEACFGLGGLGSTSACDAMTPCPSGHLCQQGRCQAAACRPSECSGILSGQKQCDDLYGGRPGFEQGTQCVEGENETRFCFAAGRRKLGEQCIDTEEGVGEERFDQVCAPGLACVQGRCLTACAGEERCEGEGACLFAKDDLVGKGVGFCGRACTAFSTGECGQGGKCLPIDAQKGYCVPAGQAAAFGSCTPLRWECEEGTICTELAQDQGRCMPMCNLTVAPMDPGAPVTRADQIQRDATCPQAPDVAYAYLRLAHLAPAAGVLEVRLDGEVLLPALEPGRLGALDASDPPGASGVLIVAPGQHLLGFYPQGSDPLTPALLEQSFSLERDALVEVVVLDALQSSSAQLTATLLPPRPTLPPPPARLGNFLLGPVSPDLSVQIRDLATSTTSTNALPPEGRFLDLPVGIGETVDLAILRGQEVLLSQKGIAITAGLTLYATGTIDLQDARPLLLTPLPKEVLPPQTTRPLYMTCNVLGNPTFGFCQETCASVDEYATNRCQGDAMGCAPQPSSSPSGWQSVCAPGGPAALGERCDPRSQVPQCVSGAHCLEYGNGEWAGGRWGKTRACAPRCATPGRRQGPRCWRVTQLRCACRLRLGHLMWGSVSLRVTLAQGTGMGHALRGCSHANPPRRLWKCRAVQVSGRLRWWHLRRCVSASGTVVGGAACAGADCVPGTECLYPRSPQATLISTLLSPYFGAQELVPVCRAQCDPFDQTMSITRCGSEETCLVNFPWSADVGHCAPVVERVDPMQACTRPGEACGKDSVCILDGELPLCLRLCEYTGGPGAGVFDRSTCPGGLECAPFVNDVGICR